MVVTVFRGKLRLREVKGLVHDGRQDQDPGEHSCPPSPASAEG